MDAVLNAVRGSSDTRDDADGTGVGSPARSRIARGLLNGTFVPDMAPGLASALVSVVFCGFVVLSLAGIVVQTGDPGQILAAILYSIPIIALQLGYFSRLKARITRKVSYLALFVQACFVCLPFLQFGVNWLSYAGLLAASVLFALPPRAAVPLFALIVAGSGLMEVVYSPAPTFPTFSFLYAIVSTTLTGLIIYGLTRLARLVADLHAARQDLVRMAAAEERLRFARDVHDLLGLSLSAITLKSELTYRLMAEHPERAREELAEMLAMSRKALADVRMVVSGKRELSLDNECRSAKGLLAAADIDVRLIEEGRRPNGQIGTVLATVLREGITNVLRHSEATWCEIVIRDAGETVEFEIRNDGLRPELGTSAFGGNGLANLSHRTESLGGRLTAEPGPGGTFRLHASVPWSTPVHV